MAKIIVEKKEIILKDGSQIKEACKDLGVTFSCSSGVCGACTIEIIKGKENLSEPTQQEKDMELLENERLACQCKILKNNVKIKIQNLEV